MAEIAIGEGPDLPGIAILPWGDVIEDFLAPLNLDAESYLKTSDGGWLFGYVRALQCAGWRPFIIWASKAVAEITSLVHPGTGATVWLVPGNSRPFAHWNGRTSIRRWLAVPVGAIKVVIDKERARAILVQEYEDPRFDRIVRLGRQMKIPVFATFQGGDQTLSWLEECIRPRSLERSSGLIIPSQFERARVERKYSVRLPPIADIPNPLRAGDWKPLPKAKARDALGIEPNAFVAVNHGRIDIKRKGLDTLVEAWSIFRSRPDEQLVIIGTGQDADLFAALLAESKPDGLRWLSEYTVDRQLILRWLSAADVYVTASRIEGMPVAPLEAMACGLPVVATDAKGLSDILIGGERHGGLLVPKGDPVLLAEALRTLRNNVAFRDKLGKAAVARVKKSYSVETVAEKLKIFLGDLTS